MSQRRLELARREAEGLRQLQNRLGLPAGGETVALYLTWLVESGATGRSIRRRLAALDLIERLEGRPPLSQRPDLVRLLRGIHRSAELGPVQPQADPLHRELLQVVVHALTEPSAEQCLRAAAMALTNATTLSATALAQLRWTDVRIEPSRMVLTPPPRHNRRAGITPGEPIVVQRAHDPRICPVALLQEARLAAGSTGLVFGGSGASWGIERIRQWLTLLPSPTVGTWLRAPLDADALLKAIGKARAPTPSQVRDRALLLLGYGAALRVHEAMHLNQGDVVVKPGGLLVTAAGRRNVAVLATGGRAEFCPVDAWLAWIDVLRESGLTGPERPAFFEVRGKVVTEHRLSRHELSRAVALGCARANLRGKYTFISLRAGYVRTSLREGHPTHWIAAQADFTALSSLARHERREQLLRKNVAAQLGL
ncbi:site-specific integrase [Nocardioides ungokensis]|uniref:hypothetical protein n=1 Tax=Nocardioides ungokensis TaxID=1643322 RepID=UPI0015DE132B|nr:hypothetical protein [Nocardioides ungokensis]